MSNQYVEDWIGSQLGDYTIQELVGEGTFSMVFRATQSTNHSKEKALKIPRSYISVRERPHEFVPTQVFIKRSDRYSPQEASPIHIQKIQVARTRAIDDVGLVPVEDYSFEKDKAFTRMPLLSGRTFRQYLRSGPIPITVLRNIAITLGRLNGSDDFGYHGDVKPENMIVTENGVIMVDCGYFGSIEESDESQVEKKALIVTTPRYYPHLKADDLLAFGLILWEAACRKPLLNGVAYSRDFDSKQASDELLDAVFKEEALGNFHFSQIIDSELPTELRPGIPESVERVLLKAARIKFTGSDNSSIDLEEGYESFEELAHDLKDLIDEGIHYI